MRRKTRVPEKTVDFSQLAPACGRPTEMIDGELVTHDDMCLCGCDAYYNRCKRWEAKDPAHSCC